MDDAAITLAAAVEALRRELAEALDAGKDQDIQFGLEPIDLTVQAAVKKEANGKIGWKILGLGGSYESARTQTLTLRLTPMLKTTTGLTRNFAIAGTSAPGDRFGPVPPNDDASNNSTDSDAGR
jgi:Trypsin-co-occurring domain 2